MKVKAHACTGSILIREEIRILKEGVHIVVGTPGRILDLMKKGFINAQNI
jgi:translation initiation factor 4A